MFTYQERKIPSKLMGATEVQGMTVFDMGLVHDEPKGKQKSC